MDFFPINPQKIITLHEKVLSRFNNYDLLEKDIAFWHALESLQKEFQATGLWKFTEEVTIWKLYRRISNKLIDLRRHKESIQKVETVHYNLCDTPPTCFEGFIAEVALTLLIEYLDRHPGKRAKVVKAFLMGGKISEIATTFKIHERTVKDYIYQFKPELKVFLKQKAYSSSI